MQRKHRSDDKCVVNTSNRIVLDAITRKRDIKFLEKNVSFEKYILKFDTSQDLYEELVNKGANINALYHQSKDTQREILDQKLQALHLIHYGLSLKKGLSLIEQAFNKYIIDLRTKIDEDCTILLRPLCIYAIYTKEDLNGALLSESALTTEHKKFIENIYSKHYLVLPITFDSVKNLNIAIDKQKRTLRRKDEIALLHIGSHGSQTTIADFTTSKSALIKSITNNTQIILHSCETAGGENPEESIAYKIAKDNKCEVFAPAADVTTLEPQIEEKEKVRVKNVAFYDRLNPVTSYRFFVKNDKSQSPIM